MGLAVLLAALVLVVLDHRFSCRERFVLHTGSIVLPHAVRHASPYEGIDTDRNKGAARYGQRSLITERIVMYFLDLSFQ